MHKEDIPVLANALRIPDRFCCPNRTVATGKEDLCIALWCFAYPFRFCDIIPRFGRSVSELCLIPSEVTEYLYNTHGHLLRKI